MPLLGMVHQRRLDANNGVMLLRISYMSAFVLLKLLSKLRKSDKM